MAKNKLTDEEIKANIAFKMAETKNLEMETRKLEAQAIREEIEMEKLKEMRRKDKSVDEENGVFRFSHDVCHTSVVECMSKLTEWHRLKPKCEMEIIFSSPGGSIIDGFELFDFLQDLRNKGHKITTGSLGMAASMAGVLLQAGDVRWIGHQSWLMIHRAAFGAIGKTYEIEDEVRFVKRIEDRILDIFTSRSKLTKNKICRNWDRKDWWINADECLELNLVDEIKAIMPEHLIRRKGHK
jgi:ATP-dependent Clp endopeptidase proteolytic subunit ClpP